MSTSEIAKLESRWRENPQGLTFAPLAEAYRKQKNPQRALEILEPGLKRNPDYIPANIVLGRCYWDLNDLPAAERAFTHVIGLDAENVIALKALADITEQQGRLDEAERWLEALLAVDRSNEDADAQLARVRRARQTQSEAGAAEKLDATPSEPVAGGQVVGFVATDESELASAESAESVVAGDPIATVESTLADNPPAPVAVAGLELSEPADPAALANLDEPRTILDPPPFEAEPTGGEFVESLPDLATPMGELASGAVEPSEALPVEEPAEAPMPLPLAADDGLGACDQSDFAIEQAEDIVLHPTARSEYQEPNAIDELVTEHASVSEASPFGEAFTTDQTATADEAPAALETAAAGELAAADEMAAVDEVAAVGGMVAAEAMAAGDETPAGSEAAAAEPPYAAAVVDDQPFSVAISEGAIREVAVSEPALVDESAAVDMSAAVEEPAALDEPAAVDERPAAAAPALEPVEVAEPALVVTESMAEVFLSQGYVAEALVVYRELARRNPDDGRLRERVAELEARAGAAERAKPRYAARETGGQSVVEFFRALLAARPSGGTSRGTTGEQPGPKAAPVEPSTGAPTRPAGEPLSLGSVFGEEPPAASPVVPPSAESSRGGASASFDAFFGGGRSSSVPGRSARPGDDDLDQFHTWLQSLKR